MQTHRSIFKCRCGKHSLPWMGAERKSPSSHVLLLALWRQEGWDPMLLSTEHTQWFLSLLGAGMGTIASSQKEELNSFFWVSKSYNQDNQQRCILFFFYYSGSHLMASRPFCRSFHCVDQLQTWLGENTEVTSAITSANGQKVPRLSPVGLWLAPGQELCYRCCVALDLQPHIAVTTLPTEIVISVLFSLKMQWRHWKITLSFINLLYSSHAFSDDWLGCFVREQLSAFSPLLSSDPLSPCSATQ